MQGTKVKVKSTGQTGYITRRLNAHEYEIWLDDQNTVVLSPKDFIEEAEDER